MSSRYQQFNDEEENAKNKSGPQKHKEIDLLDQIPADVKLTEIHLTACIVGNEDEDIKKEKSLEEQFCKCCGKCTIRKPMDLTCECSELDFLGPGYPLFFDFMKYCMFLLLILVLSAGSYNIFSNAILGEDCISIEQQQADAQTHAVVNHCELNWITLFSLANKRHQQGLNHLQEILNIFSICSIIFLLQIFRKSQRETAIACDSGDISETDYTIMVKDIPKNICSIMKEKTIKKAIEKLFNEKYGKKTIQKINVCYNIKEVTQKEQEKQEKIVLLQKEILSQQKSNAKNEEQLEKLKNDVLSKDIESDDIKSKLAEGLAENAEQNFTGIAFVSFEKEQDKDQVLEEANNLGYFQSFRQNSTYEVEGNFLTVSEAADPTDVFWENLHLENREKLKRKFISYIITFIVIFLSFLIIFILSGLQTYYNDILKVAKESKKGQAPPATHYLHKEMYAHDIDHFLANSTSNSSTTTTAPTVNTPAQPVVVNEFLIKFLAIIITIAIQILNYILNVVLKKTSEYEGYSTRTEYTNSYAAKLSIALFFNTSLVAFFVKVILPILEGLDDQYEAVRSARQSIYTAGGLVYNQQFVFLFNAFLTPIQYFVDPGRLAKLFQQYLEKKKVVDGENKSALTQNQYNLLFEHPEYDISVRYAWLMNTMFTTAFYAPLIPFALVFSFFAIVFNFWIEKYKILRQRTIKTNMGASLSIDMTDLLEYFLPIYCFANMIFEYIVVLSYQYDTEVEGDYIFLQDFILRSSNFALIGIFIGIIHAFLPMQQFNQIIFKTKPPVQNEKTYIQAETDFDNTYEKVNPVTREEALKKSQG